jgi:hypothetical protein
MVVTAQNEQTPLSARERLTLILWARAQAAELRHPWLSAREQARCLFYRWLWEKRADADR